LFSGLTFQAACGGGSRTGNATPPGNYTITVTGHLWSTAAFHDRDLRSAVMSKMPGKIDYWREWFISVHAKRKALLMSSVAE
jgi:hypothetical protein